jgi:outer membrane biosynthesis protein TonB
MNPEQEIELVLRVLSTRPTDEEIFHLEHEDVNPRKVEQKPEEKPEEEPEQEPEEEPEEKPEEEPEEEPVPLPVPVGGTLSSWTAQSVSFKKFRTHETTSSARRPADIQYLGISALPGIIAGGRYSHGHSH